MAPGSALTWRRLDVLFDAQVASRHLDHAARWLRAEGRGFYTIGSAGHEANAFVAAALRPDDPALLHYRSGGFYLARAQQVAGHDGVGDILKGLLAAADEPIAGGRHKVFGNADLAVIPQTSTIASQLPRALGVAFAIGASDELDVDMQWQPDALAVCSFGDASLNHSTAQGAINAAAQMAHRGVPLPLLLVCEDNGLGISVPTPAGWVAASLSSRPGVPYVRVDGTDPVGVYEATEELAELVREEQRPAILHLAVVRYGGHAGTDVESAYRDPGSIRADRDADPIVATARLLVAGGVATPERAGQAHRRLAHADPVACRRDDRVPAAEQRRRGDRAAGAAAAAARRRARRGRRAGDSAQAILRDVARGRTAADARRVDQPDARRAARRRSVACSCSARTSASRAACTASPAGCSARPAPHRVFDTLLDEQTILGLALGTGVSGMLPIPEIQYLAYVHNAIDQLRGEAATLSFFSTGQYVNPMVVRIAGYGYQKGFGGHFHNDNALGGLRDLPGVVVASPATGSDAAAMLRTCAAAAKTDGTVCVFLEPIALYHTRDLHTAGDGGWLSPYVGPSGWAEAHVPIGSGTDRPRRRRRADRDVGQRAVPVAARRRAAAPSKASAAGCSTCAGSLRSRSTTCCANAARRRPRRRRRRDPPPGRGRRGGRHGARRGRLHRPDRPGRRPRLVRPARRRRQPRARLRGRHRRRRAGDPPARERRSAEPGNSARSNSMRWAMR